MDDGSPIGYLIAILAFILGGGYFSATEIALASVNRIRIMSYADDGNRRAKRVLYILDHFDRALTTLLIGTNIMHISCASVATLMATKLWGVSYVTVTTIVTTFVVFLLAEMIPKRFAKANSEKFSLAVAGSLLFFMKILWPLAIVFTTISNFASKPFKKNVEEEPTVSEDELYDIIESIPEESEIDEEKAELMQSALEFSDTFVREVLTPWDKVVKLNIGMSGDEAMNVIKNDIHSRLPVIDENGNPVGLVQIRKFFRERYKNANVSVKEVMDDIHFVYDGIAIDDLLTAMSNDKTHFSVVLDKEGKTIGIVTIEDILEELVGEIYDEDDKEAAE
jgi:putative hemolysin